MSKWERKFGKYAIPNLTVILIACYVVGYILNWLAPGVLDLLTLNPYKVLHGQVWRIFTWVIAPPSTMSSYMDLFFVMIMLMFYFNLGTSLERVWGTWRYNVYIFTGIFVTVIVSFLCMAIDYLVLGGELSGFLYGSDQAAWIHRQFSTYYINMSIFLGFAATFPDAQVLLMFIIPIKVKWLGIIYGVMLVYEFLIYNVYNKFAILASLLNFIVFFLTSRNMMHLNPKQIHRRQEFKRDIRKNTGITKHKCAICGRTEVDSPNMQFRFCSKCDGNYEYCEEHLYTHTHIKRS